MKHTSPHSIGMAKRIKIPSVGKHMEKLELSHTAVRSVNFISMLKDHLAMSMKAG